MKAVSVLAAVLFASFGSAAAISVAEEEISVPGKNALRFCADPKDYILNIDHIDTDPVIPEAGKNLTIKFTGTLKEEVQEGSFVLLEVKYGPYIKLINEKMDICENAEKSVDKECPIDKGVITIEKSVALPAVIPPGAYHVSADAYNADRTSHITCLKADITFGKKTGSMFRQASGMLRENIL